MGQHEDSIDNIFANSKVFTLKSALKLSSKAHASLSIAAGFLRRAASALSSLPEAIPLILRVFKSHRGLILLSSGSFFLEQLWRSINVIADHETSYGQKTGAALTMLGTIAFLAVAGYFYGTAISFAIIIASLGFVTVQYAVYAVMASDEHDASILELEHETLFGDWLNCQKTFAQNYIYTQEQVAPLSQNIKEIEAKLPQRIFSNKLELYKMQTNIKKNTVIFNPASLALENIVNTKIKQLAALPPRGNKQLQIIHNLSNPLTKCNVYVYSIESARNAMHNISLNSHRQLSKLLEKRPAQHMQHLLRERDQLFTITKNYLDASIKNTVPSPDKREEISEFVDDVVDRITCIDQQLDTINTSKSKLEKNLQITAQKKWKMYFDTNISLATTILVGLPFFVSNLALLTVPYFIASVIVGVVGTSYALYQLYLDHNVEEEISSQEDVFRNRISNELKNFCKTNKSYQQIQAQLGEVFCKSRGTSAEYTAEPVRYNNPIPGHNSSGLPTPVYNGAQQQPPEVNSLPEGTNLGFRA